MGLVRFGEPANGADYGIVMKCGEREAYAIKHQPPDLPEEAWAQNQFVINSLLVALTLRRYIDHGFSGVFLPCPYWRKKAENRHEVGLAYFGAPSSGGIEANEFEFKFQSAWDNQFGAGFTVMFTTFIKELQRTEADSGLKLQRSIGLDYRPRLALGTLGFGFLVQHKDVFCLKTVVTEQDPIWTALRSAGIEEVYRLPSVPLEIPEDQLPFAKPHEPVFCQDFEDE
jgi:hypothetical protein